MENNLISIIIPVYNAQAYILECLNSVLNQTYKKFEVILVDDGSTDYSGEILDRFKLSDNRIKVLHQNNYGVSNARMNGLKSSKGEYIAFVDIDDILDSHYLEVLYNDALKYSADIVCCDCIETESGYDKKEINQFRMVLNNRNIIDQKTYYEDYFKQLEFYGKTVWGKLIKRTLAISEDFISIKYGEDTEYMLKLFSHNPVTYLDEYRGYYYIRWDQSATKKIDEINPLRVSDGIKVAQTLLNNCKSLNDFKLTNVSEKYLAHCVYAALSAFIKNKDYKIYHENKEYLKLCVQQVLAYKNITMKQRIAFYLYCFSDKLYWVIFKRLIKIKRFI